LLPGALTIENHTTDTFTFLAMGGEWENPPHTFKPNETIELRYAPGGPVGCVYQCSAGSFLVNAGGRGDHPDRIISEQYLVENHGGFGHSKYIISKR
jgi:hypothetical protein